MSYPRAACPKCGKDVSTHRLPWSKHAKQCGIDPNPPQAAEAITVAPDAPVAPEPVISEEPIVTDETPETTASEPVATQEVTETNSAPNDPLAEAEAELRSIADPEVRRMMAEGLAAQRRFTEAPEVFTGENWTDEHKELRRKYVPDSFPVVDPKTGRRQADPKWHVFMGDPDPKVGSLYPSRGYIPVVDPETKRHVITPNGSPMWKQPYEMAAARQAADGARAAAMTRDLDQQIAAADGGSVNQDGDDLGSVKVEKSTVGMERVDDG